MKATGGGRPRLDTWLVEHGLAPSRAVAQALVIAGRVRVDEKPATKPGSPVRGTERVSLLPGPAHVGRGAQKLEGALDRFSVDPRGAAAVDVGASTGGFTEVLLARGARIVYAVDVGRSQLHERLRADPRVVTLEDVNARYLREGSLPEVCGLATIDVSFISVLKILPAVKKVLGEGAFLLVLVKPQFEVGRFKVGRGGIVKDPALHKEALMDVVLGATGPMGFAILGACASPLLGAKGNREFFLHLVRDGSPPSPELVRDMIEKAVEG
jgi:23S rRNA (cytidine1920-2'-O)/16S rRNA (cytidine1409-2'-O)-methyltransferase